MSATERLAAALDGVEALLADAGHAPECRSCPVCRGLVTLREQAPDLLDQVARVATALAQSLREHAADTGGPGAGGGDAGTAGTRDDLSQPGRAPAAEPPWWGRPPGRGDIPRTERIDIDSTD
jgi:hypothetical protein